jgi:signal transduction histidine kinase
MPITRRLDVIAMRRLRRPSAWTTAAAEPQTEPERQARSAEDEGVWLELDSAGMVLDIQPIGTGEAGLILQLHRRAPVDYQLSRISPRLAASVARALAEGTSVTSTDVGGGGDGRYYGLRSRLECARQGEPSSLVILISSAGQDEDGVVRFALDAQDQSLALTQMLGLVGQGIDFKEAVEQLLPLLVAGVAMEAGAFFAVDDDQKRAELVAAYGPTNKRGFPYQALQLAEFPLRSVVADRGVVQLAGTTPLPESLRAVACRNAGCLVLAPGTVAQKATGIVVVSRQRTAPLSTGEHELLVAASATLGLFARTTSLMAATRQSAPVLQTAYTVSRAISRSLDLERTYEEIAASAARVVADSQCLLLESEQATGDLVSVAASGAAGERLVGVRFRYDQADNDQGDLAVGRGLTVNEVVWGAGVDSQFSAHFSLKSALLVPMIAQSELVGALLLYSAADRTYSQLEVDNAKDVAEQAAIAIHNARLYRNLASSQQRVEALLMRLTRVREQEQQRFAQLLHDDVVQSIVGSVYRLDAFRRQVPEDSLVEYDKAVELLRTSIQDARHIIYELRPPVLDGLGLVEALRTLVDRVDADGSARVGLQVSTGLCCEGTTTVIYKIAREALLNAARHAHADRVWVTLNEAGTTDACLIVRDDGIGFSADSPQDGNHYGIAMMKEQAMVAGGSLSVESVPGKGTTVQSLIPKGMGPA